ncbi:MAG TPA: HAMP domain-containing protein [Burkholderiaceae bacterium]|nr:HAMP domain-containing protein [Burkholderiaceae bacterium]
MKLRTHLNLIVAGLSAVLVAALVAVEIDSTRRSVREEIAAANIVASQLLSRIALTYARSGPGPLRFFLEQLGRVRANEITLRSANGDVLYQSPPPVYKAGREAPSWFTALTVPDMAVQTFKLDDGSQLMLEANPSRAILDGWDDLIHLLSVGGVVLLAVHAFTFWFVARALRPFPRIAEGLRRVERGDLTVRLPPYRGEEAGAISAAFNRMAQAVQQKVAAERAAREAEARLEERRELGRVVDQRLEEERRLIAHELHDEFGQSVTAIRSLAIAISGQGADPRTAEAAHLISTEAARLYDAMHGLIPRLAPLSLDSLGLAETLDALIHDWQRRYPSVRLTLEHALPEDLGPSVALTVYRVVQEGLINALRHAQPGHVTVRVQGDGQRLSVLVEDDGKGLPADWSRPGHFGLRGLRERVLNLGGAFAVDNRAPTGVRMAAEIPLVAA